jgi:hypothetical protein
MFIKKLMPIVLTSAAGVLLAALAVAQSYPHAFPRQGTVKMFENERVAIWEVNWLNNVEQPVHQHQYDMAGVYLRYGVVRVTQPNGTVNPIQQPFATPAPYFQAKGVTHKEEAIGPAGGPEKLAIMVDLKEVAAPPHPVAPGSATAFPRVGAKDLLESARVRIWDYTWEPKRALPKHTHDTDTIEVFVEGGTLVSRAADGKEESYTAAFKQARFVPRGRVDVEEATSGSPRAFVIELK